MAGQAQHCDFIVIGAGVIGLATALELLRRGASVRVIERGTVGRGSASWAGGGILAPLEPGQTPGAVRRMLRASLGMYESWVAALHEATGIDPQYHRCGMQVHQPDDVAAWQVLGRDCGFAVYVDHSAETMLHCPDVAQVRSPRLLRALAAAVRGAGGIVEQNRAVARLVPGSRNAVVELAGGGCRQAARVAVCAGAWSGALLPVPGLRPIQGQMLLIDAPAATVSQIVLAQGAGGGRYLIPRLDGPVVIGSTVEDRGFDATPDADTRRSLLAFAQTLEPALTGRTVLDHWAGLRPATPDGVPLRRWSERGSGVFLHVGHHRLGLSLAPASARDAAAALLAGPDHDDHGGAPG